ncbi:MAG: translocation/assembly module TamB domain-containing protein, partial [Prolixibacteraceae bacterium]|nr:translocation/assembly module TamB domain-containing protein [Prolixibacteraceae bacterium]
MAFLVMQSPRVQKKLITYVTQSISEKTGATVSVSRIKIALFKKIILYDLYISDQSNDTLIYSQKVVAGIDSLSFKRKSIHLKNIEFQNAKLKPVRTGRENYNFNFLFKKDTVTSKESWKAYCENFEIKASKLFFREAFKDSTNNIWFNLSDLNLEVDSVKFISTSTFSFSLKKIGFVSHDGFYLKNIKARVDCNNSNILIKNISASTQFSVLDIDTVKFDASGLYNGDYWYNCPLSINVNKLDFNFQDIAFIFPQYSSAGVDISMSGKFYGSFSEFRGKSINLSLGEVTRLKTDFYFNGLPDIDNTYMFIKLYQSYANIDKIRDMDLPDELKFIKEKMPLFLKNIGEFSYRGNFTGFKNDFVAYGTAYSRLGSLESDIAFIPDPNGKLKIKGNLKTQNLDIGKIFDTNYFGKLSLSGEISGNIKKSTYNINYNGIVDAIEMNNYLYKNLILNGNIQNKLFNGDLAVNDPNLKMKYSGKLDLSADIPAFEFLSDVKYANLAKLNFVNDSLALLSLNVDANFVGDKIDNLLGNIEIKNLGFKNRNDSLSLDRAYISNTKSGDQNHLILESEWIDGSVAGKYSFTDIVASLVNFLREYLPSSYDYGKKIENEINNFSFTFNVKDTDPFTSVFIPGLKFECPFEIKGNYNPGEYIALLESEMPYISFKNQGIEKFRLKLLCDDSHLSCRAKSEVIHFSDEFKMYNFSVESSGADDQLETDLYWNNYGIDTYSGIIKTNTSFKQVGKNFPVVEILFEPSKIFIADSLWLLDESKVVIDSTSISFEKLSLHNNDQRFFIDGILSDDANSLLQATVQNIDFHMIQSVLGATEFKGKINGKAELTDPYHKFMLKLNITIDQLLFNENKVGNLYLTSGWDNDRNLLNTELLLIDNELTLIKGNGNIDPVNSKLNLNLQFDNTPFALLEITKPKLFYNLQGFASGNLLLHGKTNNLLVDGVLTPSPEVGIGFHSIKTIFFTSEPVLFRNDSIIFDSMDMWDEYKNPGVFSGTIKHQNFQNMIFDLSIKSDKLLAINTSFSDNKRFYGTAFVNGTLGITGQAKNVIINGNFKSEKGTALYIPLERRGKAIEYDFVHFVNS